MSRSGKPDLGYRFIDHARRHGLSRAWVSVNLIDPPVFNG
jgi:hypothetical protein